jgi:glutathione S-transferase
MTLELLHIPYSPWSEKARFALAARNIPYTARAYQPILGELPLRLRLQKLTGRVSVPVLFTPDGPIEDSFAIARWAAAHGSGPELFPAGSDAEIGRWNTISERALEAGRALALGRVLGDREALLEMVPKRLRGALGPVGAKLAAAGVRRTLRKYDAVGKEHARALIGALEDLRRGIAAAPTSDSRAQVRGASGPSIAAARHGLAVLGDGPHEPERVGQKLPRTPRLGVSGRLVMSSRLR